MHQSKGLVTTIIVVSDITITALWKLFDWLTEYLLLQAIITPEYDLT